MEYLPVDEAKRATGLRLVLTAGVPGPWGESAKALFDLKGVSYRPVAQKGGAANEELVAWTGHRYAPIAILDDEPPRASWLEILFLAERLGDHHGRAPEHLGRRSHAPEHRERARDRAVYGGSARRLEGEIIVGNPG